MQRRNPFKEENPTDACMRIESSHSSRKESRGRGRSEKSRDDDENGIMQ
jgi:hypothetical protein